MGRVVDLPSTSPGPRAFRGHADYVSHPVHRLRRFAAVLVLLLLGPVLIDGSGLPCGTEGGHPAAGRAWHGTTGRAKAAPAAHGPATPASAARDIGSGRTSRPCDSGGPYRGCPMTSGSAACQMMSACNPVLSAITPVVIPAVAGAVARFDAATIPHSVSTRPEPPPPRG